MRLRTLSPENPTARILILDNHDDFGGHARRNEFQVDGKTLISHGGSETMVAPSSYSDVVKGLLADLGVDISAFYQAFDQSIYDKHDLKWAIHFTEEKWGANRLIRRVFSGWDKSETDDLLTLEQAVAMVPISKVAQGEFLRLLTIEEDQIPHVAVADKMKFLSSISYNDFLKGHLGVTNTEVLDLLQSFTQDIGLGIEDITAARAMPYALMPGWEASGLPPLEGEDEPYIHHFPDGNASIARLLVRALIPG